MRLVPTMRWRRKAMMTSAVYAPGIAAHLWAPLPAVLTDRFRLPQGWR